MSAIVRLSDIVDALEMQFDGYSSYLDCSTGQVETISDDLWDEAQESADDEVPADWEKEEWDLARQIVSTDRFQALPTKFDVHEWAIMRDFALSAESTSSSEDLLDALHGSGAFRHFKDTLYRYHMEKSWYAFRTAALRQIAIDWCEEHHIVWTE
jgi:hypothetical protein